MEERVTGLEQAGSQAQLRLFLHIGLPKTGTTSLQLRFFENAASLKQLGFLYPVGQFENPKYQHSAMIALVSPARMGDLTSFFASIRQEAVSSGCHTVILSGEAFYRLSARQLRLLLDTLGAASFRPTIVMFFRPTLDYLRSLASQAMKTQGKILVASTLARHAADFDCDEVEARFAAVFGMANVVRHDLSRDDDCVPFFDKDIGLVADLPAAWHNTRADFATLSWLNAVKTELGISTGVVHRFLMKAFKGRPPILAAETAFLSEVADMVGGRKGEALKSELAKRITDTHAFSSHQERLEYLVQFHNFVGMLRRYMWRKTMRRKFWALLGRSYESKRRERLPDGTVPPF